MKKKIIGIVILALLIMTVLPAVGTMNIRNDETMNIEPKLTSTDIVWSDNFDSYDLGQELDGTPDDGGWKLFDNGINDPWPGGGEVVNDQFRSEPHSLESFGNYDIIREFTGINSGSWTFTAWIYVPDECTYGGSIGLGSYYVPGSPYDNCWHLSIGFDNVNDIVYDWFGDIENNLPVITNQWVELRLELNLEDDWCECYYNNELLIEGVWTDLGTANGYRNFAAINFFYGEYPIYFDDLSIEGETNGLESDLEGDGSLNWADIPAESIVNGNFTLENNGDSGSRLEWIVYEYPDFGTWYCEPSKGDFEPNDEPITVQVTVKAPEDKNKEFIGDLKIKVIGNPDDEVVIPVTLTTPKSKSISEFNPWIFRLIQRFPILEFLL